MKRVLVYFIVGIVLFGSCSVQNVNAQNVNISQRIIGTWVCNESGQTWTFNANGDYSWSLLGNNQGNKFVVTDSQLAIRTNNGLAFFDISISSNGNEIILRLLEDKLSGFTIWRHYWLTKR